MFRNREVSVVVVPGRDGARRGPVPPCDACGTNGSGTRIPAVLEGVVMVLCFDAGACALRYREGASPESYAAALRGDLLAVTP